jgi:hypothetical protein
MKFRNTLILLLLAGGIYCFMRFYESKQPTTQEAEDLSAHVVPQLDSSGIDGITITNNETKIQLTKRDNQWQMDSPVKDRADDAAVQQLLGAVEDLEKDTTIKPGGDRTDVRDYGVTKATVTLELTGSGAPPALLFGKDTAVEGKEYLRLANSNDIYVVPTDLRNQVTKPVDDFREHRLSDVAATQVTGFNIKTAAGEIALTKAHEHWVIDQPIKARGDDEKISDLVAQVLNTRIDSFVSAEQAGAANTALNDPAGTVSVTAEGVDKPVELELSKPTDASGKVYAKLSTRDAAFVLSGTVSSVLNTKPADVRDRHLIRLDLNTVDRIHIAPAGAPEILLARKGEDWTIKSMNDRPGNSSAVQAMANTLSNQLVRYFVSDVATDLPKYGLDQPRLKVTFSSYASENTAETKAGEEPLESILFGKSDSGSVYAKLDDEPFIVTVPQSMVDMIYTDPLKWQSLEIYKLSPDNIAGLDVTTNGQAKITLVKLKGEWKPAKGDIALNTANIEAMVNTLATLQAAEWAGAPQPSQGLDKPAVTITYTTTDGKSNTLSIGAPSGDEWFASAAGKDGIFLISHNDHDALTAPILPMTAPVTSPAK